MSLLLPLSLMDLTRRELKRETFLSSISEVEPLMSLSSPLMTESLKSKPLTETPILEEKISITELSITALKTSRRRVELTSEETTELSEDSELSARRLREFSLLLFLPQLSATPLLKEKITTLISPE